MVLLSSAELYRCSSKVGRKAAKCQLTIACCLCLSLSGMSCRLWTNSAVHGITAATPGERCSPYASPSEESK